MHLREKKEDFPGIALFIPNSAALKIPSPVRLLGYPGEIPTGHSSSRKSLRAKRLGTIPQLRTHALTRLKILCGSFWMSHTESAAESSALIIPVSAPLRKGALLAPPASFWWNHHSSENTQRSLEGISLCRASRSFRIRRLTFSAGGNVAMLGG